VELQGRLKNIQRDGLGLAAISYDPVSVLADFSQRRGITFPLLSDEGSRTIKEYGLLNTTVPETNKILYGIPFPGTFFVDRDGVVTSRVFETAYQERDTISSLMVRLGGTIDAPATKIAAPHLDLTTYTTDQTVAPGTHFSIVLDVKPGRRVHVYAPGVTGYRPIKLTIEAQPGLVVRDAQYPKPVDYYFKPLNEHVQVFSSPFRVIQDVAIDASRESEAMLKERASFTVRGTLDYQACDDKVCFTPQSVPLSWTLSLKPLDRERRQ
jgi:AhpC/TSA family protein/cytochrome c biogenesis DsbD-like protein